MNPGFLGMSAEAVRLLEQFQNYCVLRGVGAEAHLFGILTPA